MYRQTERGLGMVRTDADKVSAAQELVDRLHARADAAIAAGDAEFGFGLRRAAYLLDDVL
jgi:hypothetical protein